MGLVSGAVDLRGFLIVVCAAQMECLTAVNQKR